MCDCPAEENGRHVTVVVFKGERLSEAANRLNCAPRKWPYMHDRWNLCDTPARARQHRQRQEWSPGGTSDVTHRNLAASSSLLAVHCFSIASLKPSSPFHRTSYSNRFNVSQCRLRKAFCSRSAKKKPYEIKAFVFSSKKSFKCNIVSNFPIH